MTVDATSRFRKARPCPICQGGDDMPRGKGRRCSGYLSSDGRFAFCTREEHAGRLEPQPTDPATWRHLLEGECHCGVVHAPARTKTTYFEYQDEQGEPLFRTARLDGPDGKRIWQERHERGSWIKPLGDARRVLYRLPSLIDADTVHISEGEPCADALAGLGLVATTSPMGAGKWRAEYADQIAQASRVVVWADCDTAGRDHARTIAESLAGRIPDVRVIELDRDRHDGYDVANLIAAASRNGHADDVRGYLDQIAEQAPTYLSRPGRDAIGTRTASGPSEKRETAIASPRPDVVGTRDGTRSFSDGDEALNLHLVSVSEFSNEIEPGAGAIVGTDDDALVPEAGTVMFYGAAGSTKTTLTVDLTMHLAAGDDWLGIPVARPVRVAIVENEGPRALFRAKLRRKLAGWTGSPLGDRLLVLEEPWGKVSLGEEQVRDALAAQIAVHEIDVLVIGPVIRSGWNEAGTLQEVRAYMDLVVQVRELSGRRVTFVLVHHENRAGTPSGAWEGEVDTLLQAQAQGNGQTRLFVQKARWAGSWHRQKLQLGWTDGEGFRVLEQEERDDNTVADEILDYVLEHGGTGWNRVEETVEGKGDRLRGLRASLLESGRLVNTGSAARMKLWHADDPARPYTQDGLA